MTVLIQERLANVIKELREKFTLVTKPNLDFLDDAQDKVRNEIRDYSLLVETVFLETINQEVPQEKLGSIGWRPLRLSFRSSTGANAAVINAAGKYNEAELRIQARNLLKSKKAIPSSKVG